MILWARSYHVYQWMLPSKVSYFKLFCNLSLPVCYFNWIFGDHCSPSSEFINAMSKFVIACATTPHLLSFYWFLNQWQVNTSERFPLIDVGAVQSLVPCLQEKPLVIVVDTVFEDLGILWVDVVICGLSMLFNCWLPVAQAAWIKLGLCKLRERLLSLM